MNYRVFREQLLIARGKLASLLSVTPSEWKDAVEGVLSVTPSEWKDAVEGDRLWSRAIVTTFEMLEKSISSAKEQLPNA